jgi:dienelactone hydrolase
MIESSQNPISLRRRIVWGAVTLAVLATVLFGCTVLIPAWRDPVKFFTSRRSQAFEARVDTLWHESGLILQSLRIEGRRNRDGSGAAVAFNAYTCRPRNQADTLPAFVLMGGIRTGRDAIRLISQRPEIAEMGLFITLDYPWAGPKKFKGLQIVPYIPGIRRALFDGVEAVRLAIDYLERQEGIDHERIILLGGSVGAFYVVDAGAIDPRPAAVVAFMGGGRLGSLLDWNLRHGGYTSSRIVSSFFGQLTALLIRPLEPVRLVGHISPIPYVQISATEDERIPEANALALYNASRDPHRLIWITTIHVMPYMDELIEQMMAVARKELVELGLLRSGQGQAH